VRFGSGFESETAGKSSIAYSLVIRFLRCPLRKIKLEDGVSLVLPGHFNHSASQARTGHRFQRTVPFYRAKLKPRLPSAIAAALT
jgi:hypothetical protein